MIRFHRAPSLTLVIASLVVLGGCEELGFFNPRADCSNDDDCGAFYTCDAGTCVAPQGSGTGNGGGGNGGGGGVSVLPPGTGGGNGDGDAGSGDTGNGGADAGDPPTGDPSRITGDENWDRWGTRGSTTGLVNRYAHCDTRSVRTDDLERSNVPNLGSPPWGAGSMEDAQGYCGSAQETLGWRLVNCERMSRDLHPLRCDLRLVAISAMHSQDMISRRYFSHDTPEGLGPSDRANAAGLTEWRYYAENIANYPDVVSAHLGWMESDGHRANMLSSDPNWLGEGLALQEGRVYATQNFSAYFGD